MPHTFVNSSKIKWISFENDLIALLSPQFINIEQGLMKFIIMRWCEWSILMLFRLFRIDIGYSRLYWLNFRRKMKFHFLLVHKWWILRVNACNNLLKISLKCPQYYSLNDVKMMQYESGINKLMQIISITMITQPWPILQHSQTWNDTLSPQSISRIFIHYRVWYLNCRWFSIWAPSLLLNHPKKQYRALCSCTRPEEHGYRK